LITLGLVYTGSNVLFSQSKTASPELLVSGSWLEENLTDPALVILHYGKQEDFEQDHIPGARLVSIRELLVENEHGIRHELPDEQIIEQVIRSWGIHNNSKIVICYAEESSIPMAARLLFTLDYAGLSDQLALLNGGLIAWKDENRPLSKGKTTYEEGNFDIMVQEGILVTKDEVLASLDSESILILDARPVEQYSGKAKDHNSKRKGHIEGAINIPFSELTLEDSPHMFMSKDDLQEIFNDQNIQTGSTIVVYCGSGIWASPVYFAVRFLGYEARFYDASFQEWGNDESLPISTLNKLF